MCTHMYIKLNRTAPHIAAANIHILKEKIGIERGPALLPRAPPNTSHHSECDDATMCTHTALSISAIYVYMYTL